MKPNKSKRRDQTNFNSMDSNSQSPHQMTAKSTDKIDRPIELRRSKRISSKFSSITKPKNSSISKARPVKRIKAEKVTLHLCNKTTTIEKNAENSIEFLTIKRLLAQQTHIRTFIASIQERRTNETLLYSDLFTHLRRKHDLVWDQVTIQQNIHEQQRETAEGLNRELRMLRDRIKNERGENIEIEGSQVSFIQISEE